MKIETYRFNTYIYDSDKKADGIQVQRIRIKIDLDYRIRYHCFEYLAYFGNVYRGGLVNTVSWDNYNVYGDTQERLIFDDQYLMYEYHQLDTTKLTYKELKANMYEMIADKLSHTFKLWGSEHVTAIQLLFTGDIKKAALGIKIDLTKLNKLMLMLDQMQAAIENNRPSSK